MEIGRGTTPCRLSCDTWQVSNSWEAAAAGRVWLQPATCRARARASSVGSDHVVKVRRGANPGWVGWVNAPV